MLSQITLARDEAQRLVAFGGIRNSRQRSRLVHKVGIAYFLIMTLLDYLVDVFFLADHLPALDVGQARLAQTYFVLQVLSQFCLMRFTSRWDNVKQARTQSYQLPSHASGPWRSCHDCGRTCPPRSHHCPICRCCVLKRDHHCYLTGVCVGFHNQRHFIVYSFYCALSSLTFLKHTYTYFLTQNIDILSRDIYQLFLPVTLFRYANQNLGLDICMLTMLLYLTASCALAASLSLLQQMFFALSGRTSYEVKSGRNEYSESYCRNLVSVFGKAGLLLFFVPIPLPYHGDGYTWKYQYKSKFSPRVV